MAGLDVKGLSISIQSSLHASVPLPITSSIIFKSLAISETDKRHTQPGSGLMTFNTKCAAEERRKNLDKLGQKYLYLNPIRCRVTN